MLGTSGCVHHQGTEEEANLQRAKQRQILFHKDHSLAVVLEFITKAKPRLLSHRVTGLARTDHVKRGCRCWGGLVGKGDWGKARRPEFNFYYLTLWEERMCFHQVVFCKVSLCTSVLELSMQTRLWPWTCREICLCLPNAMVNGTLHPTQNCVLKHSPDTGLGTFPEAHICHTGLSQPIHKT